MQNMVGTFARNANFVVMAYAINNKDSFDNLHSWLRQLNRDPRGSTLPIAVVAVSARRTCNATNTKCVCQLQNTFCRCTTLVESRRQIPVFCQHEPC